MATTRICAIPDCGKPHRGFGFCATHYKRFKKHGDPNIIGFTPAGAPLRFLKELLGYQGKECVVWPFARDKGYAKMFHNNRSTSAYRVMCMLEYGPPPEAHYHACHECNNGPGGCVNPRHLRWDTPKGNTGDRYKHGTIIFGADNQTTVLTRDEVKEIRRLLNAGVSRKDLAARYNVAYMTIANVHRRKNYRDV